MESLHKFSTGKTVEGGAELIGSNHPLWRAYASHFGLQFSDVKDYGDAPVRMGGHTLTFEETERMTEAFEKFKDELNFLAETVVDPYEPWATPHAKSLDDQSLADWLSQFNCERHDEDCKRGLAALRQQLVADNGVAATEQSLLGVLAMVKGHGIDKYWLDTEVWRCRGGNQQLENAKGPRPAVHRNLSAPAERQWREATGLALPAWSPNLNAFAERFVGSAKSEYLDGWCPWRRAFPGCRASVCRALS